MGLSPATAYHSRHFPFTREAFGGPHTTSPRILHPRIQFVLFPLRSPLHKGIAIAFYSWAYEDASTRPVTEGPKSFAHGFCRGQVSHSGTAVSKGSCAYTALSLLDTPFIGCPAKASGNAVIVCATGWDRQLAPPVDPPIYAHARGLGGRGLKRSDESLTPYTPTPSIRSSSGPLLHSFTTPSPGNSVTHTVRVLNLEHFTDGGEL